MRMRKIVIEIDNKRHRLVKSSNGGFLCNHCSLSKYCDNTDTGICVELCKHEEWCFYFVEDADPHLQEVMVDIEKVCEWLTQNFLNYMKYHNDGEKVYYTYNNEKLIDDLKKAMGGE